MRDPDASARRLHRLLGNNIFTVGVKERDDGTTLIVYVVKGKPAPARLPETFERWPVRLVRIEKVRPATVA